MNRRPFCFRTVLLSSAAAAVLLVAASCGSGESPDPAAAAPPVAVRATSVAMSDVDVTLQAVGTVEPVARAQPATRVAGRVTRIAADRGDLVAAGQLLVAVDSQDLRQGLEAARANRDRAEAEWSLARADYERAEALFVEDAIAQQALDRARAAHDAARAGLEGARRRVGEAKAHLAYGEVRAPFAGRVTARMAEVGNLAAPGVPLFTVERTDSVDVLVSVAESAAGRIDVGATAIARVADHADTGIVQSVIAVPAGRSYDVRLRIANPSGRLRSGQFARAEFRIDRRDALLLDSGLVVEQGQLRGVYVLTADHAVLRWIRLGERFGDRVEVLSGLTPGDRVIEPEGVHDGAPVKVVH